MKLFSQKSFHVVAGYILGALLLGCGRMLSIDYQPTNPWKGQGAVTVAPFRYEVAGKDGVKPREVETNRAAETELFLSQEIGSFFTEALTKELVHSGYAVTPSSPLTIRGSITRFYVDARNGVERFFELHATYTVQSQDHAPFTWECSSLQYGPNTLAQDSILIRKGTADCMQRFIQAALDARVL